MSSKEKEKKWIIRNSKMDISVEVLKERAKLFRDFPIHVKPSNFKFSHMSPFVAFQKALTLRQKDDYAKRTLSISSDKAVTCIEKPELSVIELLQKRKSRKTLRSFEIDNDVVNDVTKTEIPEGINRNDKKCSRRRGSFFAGSTSVIRSPRRRRSRSLPTDSPVSNQRHLWRRASNCLTFPIILLRKKSMDKKAHAPQFSFQKTLLAKFKMAGRLAIFCARNFKQHCLRINENQDELAPFIKRLHFHEDDNPDLLIDLSKFKANRQLRIPDETKRILSKEVGERTEQELYSVTLALRNIKSYAEYPNRMQRKIAEVGLYEKYESKRVIVRQNHPATAFYFILSGAVVVMVMDEDTKFARPVAHLYKGQTFGELAIINGTKRNSTVIAKETCEFLSISVQDYNKIFMAGGVKNISDPDQEIFLRSLKCLATWPIQILPQHPNKCQFLFFKNADVIIRDSSLSEWIIIVKSGSIQVLKKLKKVEAFAWKKKKDEPITLADKKEVILKQNVFRKILPELKIPLSADTVEEQISIMTNGRPLPFKHPGDPDENISMTSSQPSSSSRVPNLWPFDVDLSQMESGRYLEDESKYGIFRRYQPNEDLSDKSGQSKNKKRSISGRLARKYRSNSIVNEEEAELGGFQPHIRTIQEDLDPGATRHGEKDEDENTNQNPEFVLVHTLTKGQVFGLSDLIIGEQPSFSVVSKGADCILINKHFYMEHASDKLLNEMRQELCPYPTEEELQQRLQESVDWHAYRKTMLLKSLDTVGVRRHMRTTVQGTKVQEAY